MININNELKKLLIYPSPIIKTHLRDSVNIIFADFTASGRPSPIVEKYISEKILPFYSNTHSNAYCGILMKQKICETKQYLKKILNLDNNKKIIFTGTGATCTVNHLIHCMNLHQYENVIIYLSIYEHHSNYLPWVELSKKYNNIKIVTINPRNDFTIDIENLENSIKNTNKNIINIIAITACSNVTGIINDIPAIYNMLQKYNIYQNKNNNCECNVAFKQNILLVDYACAAPYVKIDGRFADALFISPHKFLGGHSTPGLLIGDKNLFCSDLPPFTPGGGCVKKVCKKEIIYDNDIEKKESGGTPNIIGIIKIGFIFKLKDKMQEIIHTNEKFLSEYVFSKIKNLTKDNENFIMILPDRTTDRLPIVCFNIKNIHYNLIVVLLNDLFGIQTRGGVSCTSLLAEHIEKLYGIKGWCRVSFNWLMTKEEVDYIIDSIIFVTKNINDYKDKYEYNKETNLFEHL